MKIKETLNLGQTAFPMRAGLPNKEPEMQKAWDQAGLYAYRQQQNQGKPSFMLHDGPPYANGNIHVGHALNKISKDIIIRYKNMAGFRAPYVPGWDTHGLPIEQVLAKQGVKRKEMERSAYLAMARDYALSQVETQKADFKRLGVLGDWDNPYVTLQPAYEAAQIRVFGSMAAKGYIYKGAKPIYWSPSSESSLAEAEIEYQDVKSASIYVAFKALDTKGLLPDKAEFIIWTTTPWTLPANMGIFAHPDYDYVLVDVKGRQFVLASELLSKVAEVLDWEDYKVLDSLRGSQLEGMQAKHPFYDRTSQVMTADYVTLDAGTGLVHVAPGHGEDDYLYSRKYHLEVLSPIDDRGYYTDQAPGFEGLFYDEGNKKATSLLEANNALLKLDFFTHSYPHDWRTKKPVIFRATPQWFASIDDFRQNILDEVEGVNWVLPWGKTRLYNMIRDRGDWVISRQRAWGVPLPIFYAENGDVILTQETTDHVADLFEVHGSIIWWEKEAKDLLPEGFTHPGSPNGHFTKETDIMDVWFDSGSSWHGVLNAREQLSYPADLYLEGSDQYRGWFNSSITTAVAVTGQAPYKAVLSQGFVMDGKGRKMSKSLGNIISPNDVAKQYGADILRLWVASVDTTADMRVSMEILGQVSESYRKIRNTMRFLIANTSDFDKEQDGVAFTQLGGVDQYMMIRLNQVIEATKAAYDRYDFMAVYKHIYQFLTQDLSAFYLDFAKDVVYIEAQDAPQRRKMQTVMYEVLVSLTKLLLPIIPHTAEEIWAQLDQEDAAYAYLADMPEVINYPDSEQIEDTWRAFLEVRRDVLKALEMARDQKTIGKSLEAKVVLYSSEPVKVLIKSLVDQECDIAQLLIVSAFELSDKPLDTATLEEAGTQILVQAASGKVCARCRRTDMTVGSHPNQHLDSLCTHCAAIISQHFPQVLVEGFEA